jgi:hypothetical protein
VSGPVLGRSWIPKTDSDEIGWFDPVTLRRKGRSRAALPQQTAVWAVSPGGRFVAVGPARHEVWIIDTRTLRPVGPVRSADPPNALAWLSDDALAGVTPGEAVLWNATGKRIRSFELTPSERVEAWLAASDRLIALTTPDWRGGGGSPRLLVVTETVTQVVELDGTAAGYDPDLGEHGTQLTPGLAYDPTGRRAFVVPADGPIAEVDVDDGTVGYHSPSTSVLETAGAALVPPAGAKLSAWTRTEAVWLGAGLIAVSGFSAETLGLDGEAGGVTILDTEDWTSCVLDRRPTHVAVTGGTLLAWGGADLDERGGVGLVGYDLTDGGQWHLFGQQYLDVQVYGPYAYAINSWDGWHVSTVDVSIGRVIAEHEGRPPTVLPNGSSVQGW